MTNRERWDSIYGFWFGKPGSSEHGAVRDFWFGGGPELDLEIRQRFEADYQMAAADRLREWYWQPRSCIALIVLLDQIPRNMYRGDGRAFAKDDMALAAARHLVHSPMHRELLTVEKLFAYLPFEHSEAISDQDIAVRLFADLEDHDNRQEWLRYAEDHRDIIRQFGRFPHRNLLLGRESTPEEIAWLASNNERYGTAPRPEETS